MQPIESAASKNAKRPGFGNRAKYNLRIDMTPMVDLGFLLITFFVITTQLSEPKAIDLFIPTDGKPMDLGESGALTVLLEKENTIYYYHGNWESALKNKSIYKTTYAGEGSIRRIIEDKQKALDANKSFKEGRDRLMLLIKPGDHSSYKNVVDVLDEVMICSIRKYAILPKSADEIIWLDNLKQ